MKRSALFYNKSPRWLTATTGCCIVETKKTWRGDHVQLGMWRPIEELKIECGKRRFKVLSSLNELLS